MRTAWQLSDVSGLPLPGDGGVPPPSGASSDLRVLDWAGYEGAVSFSFDDTQPSHIQHWRKIQATGVRATWYLSQVYRQNAAFETTWAEVLAAGHEIGNHTTSHHYVSELAAAYPTLTTAEAAKKELDECDAYIQGVIGQNGVWTMAYPYGDTAWEPYLEDRYLFARTVIEGTVSATQDLNQLRLPTYTVVAGDTRTVFQSKLEEAVKRKSWRTLLFHSLLPTDQNWYAGVPVSDVVAGIEHGKNEGTVWLDSVVNVGAYWMAAKLLRAAQPAARSGQLTWNWTLPRHFPSGKYLRVAIGGGHLRQDGVDLAWNGHGFYEVALDAGSLTWRPATRSDTAG